VKATKWGGKVGWDESLLYAFEPAVPASGLLLVRELCAVQGSLPSKVALRGRELSQVLS
jgi:hypothetical protein